jgi:predicted enzyme related to lactoylglutathione lyase
MPNRDSYTEGEFSWVDLTSPDLAKAKQFYQGLFGWESVDFDTDGGPPYAGWMLREKNVGGLGQMSEEMKAQGLPPTWNCYIRVDDAEAIEHKAVGLGAHVLVPTMPVMDAAKLNFLVDPTGAVFATFQPLNDSGSQMWSEDNAPCWCELATRDIEGAREFYEKLVGWTCNEFPQLPSKYYVANVEETRMVGGLLEMNEQWGETPPHWSVYFQVADVAASCAKCVELGGQVCVPAFDAGVGRIAGCADSHGAFFYLIKLADPSR